LDSRVVYDPESIANLVVAALISSQLALEYRKIFLRFFFVRHTVNSQLVADIVTKRALHLYYHTDVCPTSKALKQNTRTRLAVTFYPFADKNSIVSSYFIVEKRVFCGDI